MSSTPTPSLFARLDAILRADPDLMRLLTLMRALGLPEWRLVSGAIYQTVWNVLTNRPRGTGIKDYDVIYFDASDLSYAAEDAWIKRVEAVTRALPKPVELRNQARVHLWYEQRFGMAYAPLASADDSLLHYASICQAVAVRLEADDRLDIAAPFGLDDVFDMVIRPNRAKGHARTHAEKAARAVAIWPELRVEAWWGLTGGEGARRHSR